MNFSLYRCVNEYDSLNEYDLSLENLFISKILIVSNVVWDDTSEMDMFRIKNKVEFYKINRFNFIDNFLQENDKRIVV